MITTAEPTVLCPVPTPNTHGGWPAPVRPDQVSCASGDGRTTAEALEQTLRRRIAQRTWGRLRQLEVEVDAQRVIVRGSSPTYYLEQLALAAVQEVLPGTAVELDITVARSRPALASEGS